MTDRNFDIPAFEYFSNMGRYSGGKRGENKIDFNFRITPGERILVEIWYGIYCFEKSELFASEFFPPDNKGYGMMLEWIDEQYAGWLKANKPKDSSEGVFIINDYNIG